jgi:hypothetical protein
LNELEIAQKISHKIMDRDHSGSKGSKPLPLNLSFAELPLMHKRDTNAENDSSQERVVPIGVAPEKFVHESAGEQERAT